jgi:hypothetical protein
MKKLSVLFLLLWPFILFSQVQPTTSSAGFKFTGTIEQPSPNRSIPPGTLVWSQLPDCGDFGAAYASQSDLIYPFDAKTADDFLFASSPGPITAVRWWTGYWNPDYASPLSFNIIIYDDAGCLPGNEITSWNIPFAGSNEEAGCYYYFPSREYWATLSPAFNPVPGQHYWIAIQSVLIFPPQSGCATSLTQNLCTAAQRFDPFNGPFWYSITPPTGYPTPSLAFELYASDVPFETPVSSWALVLGGVLIATAIFLRYRRIS